MKVQVRFFDVDTEAGEDYIADLDNRVHEDKRDTSVEGAEYQSIIKMVEEIREAKNNGDWFNGSPIRNVNLTVASKMGISVKRVEKAITSSKKKK